jgi:hypothetical protein
LKTSGPVDGIAGTFKRYASNAILRCVEECPMKIPFEWATKNVQGISFRYVDMEEYDKHKLFPAERMECTIRLRLFLRQK